VTSISERSTSSAIGGDHLARHEIAADAEVLDRAPPLGAPELAVGIFDRTEAAGLRMAV
jgi:hypothetical protein